MRPGLVPGPPGGVLRRHELGAVDLQPSDGVQRLRVHLLAAARVVGRGRGRWRKSNDLCRIPPTTEPKQVGLQAAL